MPDELNPFCLDRKAERVSRRKAKKLQATGIVSIEPDGRAAMRCIRVSSQSAMYVTDGYVPTHNSSDKTELFATALGCYLDGIAGVFNRQLLPRLWRLNGLEPELMPTIGHGDIEQPDLEKLSQFLVAMVGAGAVLFPDRELENHLRESAGFPPAPEESAEDGADFPGTGDLSDDIADEEVPPRLVAMKMKPGLGDVHVNRPLGSRRRRSKKQLALPLPEPKKTQRIRKEFEYDANGMIKAVVETVVDEAGS
jgi:hypothetical protein